jgi:hypothetical protein
MVNLFEMEHNLCAVLERYQKIIYAGLAASVAFIYWQSLHVHKLMFSFKL